MNFFLLFFTVSCWFLPLYASQCLSNIRFINNTFSPAQKGASVRPQVDKHSLTYVIGLCVLLICAMQFGLILVRQELRLRLVLTRFSLWRLLQNQTLTTSFSRWRPLAILAISWEDGLLFSTKLRSRASLAPRLQWETRRENELIVWFNIIVWY